MSRSIRTDRPYSVWIHNHGWGIHATFASETAAMERARREQDNGWTVAITEEKMLLFYQGKS